MHNYWNNARNNNKKKKYFKNNESESLKAANLELSP